MKLSVLKQINVGLTLLLCATSMAQKTVGDFIESRSYNEARRGAERVLRYQPDGNDFVCVNGINRYSRALYGGYTDYRIETSDRPIFAIYKKRAASGSFHPSSVIIVISVSVRYMKAESSNSIPPTIVRHAIRTAHAAMCLPISHGVTAGCMWKWWL